MKHLKPIFVLLLCGALVLSFVGCQKDETPEPIETPSQTSEQPKPNDPPSNPTPNNPTPNGPEAYLIAPSSNPLSEPSASACPIQILFPSSQALTTYVETGSVDAADYEGDETDWIYLYFLHNLPDYPAAEYFREGYSPFEELFSLDEDWETMPLYISAFANSRWYHVLYDFGSINVSVAYAPEHYNETTSQNSLDYLTLDEDTIITTRYADKALYDECYVSRATEVTNITYFVENGEANTATFILGNYKIRINKTDVASDFATLYPEDMAKFDAFFSEDDATVNAAMRQLVRGIAESQA